MVIDSLLPAGLLNAGLPALDRAEKLKAAQSAAAPTAPSAAATAPSAAATAEGDRWSWVSKVMGGDDREEHEAVPPSTASAMSSVASGAPAAASTASAASASMASTAPTRSAALPPAALPDSAIPSAVLPKVILIEALGPGEKDAHVDSALRAARYERVTALEVTGECHVAVPVAVRRDSNPRCLLRLRHCSAELCSYRYLVPADTGARANPACLAVHGKPQPRNRVYVRRDDIPQRCAPHLAAPPEHLKTHCELRVSRLSG